MPRPARAILARRPVCLWGRFDVDDAVGVAGWLVAPALGVAIRVTQRPGEILRSKRTATSPTAAGITASTTMHGCADRNGGASVADPAASLPASTAAATTSASKASAATHMIAGNRQFGGSPRR